MVWNFTSKTNNTSFWKAMHRDFKNPQIRHLLNKTDNLLITPFSAHDNWLHLHYLKSYHGILIQKSKSECSKCICENNPTQMEIIQLRASWWVIALGRLFHSSWVCQQRDVKSDVFMFRFNICCMVAWLYSYLRKHL